MSLPNWREAPTKLLEIDDHCGLLAAWMVLRHFRKRVSVQGLVTACKYTKGQGVFAIGLAACLKMHGLQVSFFTEPDPAIGGFEKRCYARAARLGVLPQPAVPLSAVLRAHRRGYIPIVLFNSEDGIGHFSPLIGLSEGMVKLPLADGNEMPKNQFIDRWSEPGILRQCVIARI
jgi:hypothetical protein